MLLKNDLRGPYAQLRFKRLVAYAISIQTTGCPDSIVAHSVFVADFFNSSAPRRRVTPVEEGSIQEIVG
jgi:hypothetical protein